MIHPLLDPNSTHYDTQEKPTIYYIEEKLTIAEMIGVCKFHQMKYDMREKGQNDLDIQKIQRYTNYMHFLTKCMRNYRHANKTSCRQVIDTLYPKLSYNAKDN